MLAAKNEKMDVSHYKILVVDDNRTHLQLLNIWLRESGFTVVTVNSGYEALERFNHEDFDLVLTDVDMPGINGNILAQYIHNISKKTPVVALTASLCFDDSNFDLVINKPYELEGLVNSLQYVLQEKTSISYELNLKNRKVLYQLQGFEHGHQTD
ncbi:Response regulator receiver domain-containing protein [Desulfuromusa kysingii]|uniref:Response regulator receiver domain-containing protein n=1 Tax=Desulfuromusa kysingii TaxID=37625 RepID=A0A1H3W7A9_9BACT|nr:response regulator [Desulfuromusa kysingii]SDZ82967.1 Response regulator receiver domain-containing protein [Desulfuromusa kysingii]